MHVVINEDFVEVDTATGVVHLAPGNGEEDFWAAQRRGVPVFAPFDDEVKFTKDAGAFNGVFARDADKLVVEELKKRNAYVAFKKSQTRVSNMLAFAPQAGMAGKERVFPENRQDKQQSA